MGSSSTQPVTQQTTQTKDPWGPAQPYLQQGMQIANNYMSGNVGYQPYGGDRLAAEFPWLSQGLGAQASIASQNLGGTPGILAAQNLGTNQIKNEGLSSQLQGLLGQISGQQNPYLQGIIDQQVGKANAAASGMGRYGSGAHDAAIAQAIAPTLAQDYTQRLQQQQNILEGGLSRAGQWSQVMPTLDQAQYAPAQTLAAAGQYETNRSQQAINNAVDYWNALQAQPWEQLQRFNAIVGGAGGLGATTVSGTPIQQPSSLQRLFGGAAAGAGIGSAIMPGIGTGIGALGGGLLGLL